MTRINQCNKTKKKTKPRTENNVIREIRRYQKSTKLLIKKKSFEDLVRGILQNIQQNEDK